MRISEKVSLCVPFILLSMRISYMMRISDRHPNIERARIPYHLLAALGCFSSGGTTDERYT